MVNTKEDLINKYLEIKGKLNKAPNSREFYKEAEISKRTVEKFFGSNAFTKLTSECGDIPNKFSKDKSSFIEILVQYGKLYREINKHPTGADWTFYNCQPTVNGITGSHKIKWIDMPQLFQEFAIGKKEWEDVIEILPDTNSYITNNEISKNIDGLTLERLKFIPPVVNKLIEFSRDEQMANEFEKNVNLVFEMLGFEVTKYGQGTGRNPDGIAKESQNHYAILIDAKSRKDNYKLGTEDRKFIEYIKTFSEPLRKSGFSNIYFLIVSSEFSNTSQAALKNIKIETQVSTTLLTSKLLLKLLSNKIQNPRLFDLKKFQELLIVEGKITEDKIDKFITGRK